VLLPAPSAPPALGQQRLDPLLHVVRSLVAPNHGFPLADDAEATSHATIRRTGPGLPPRGLVPFFGYSVILPQQHHRLRIFQLSATYAVCITAHSHISRGALQSLLTEANIASKWLEGDVQDESRQTSGNKLWSKRPCKPTQGTLVWAAAGALEPSQDCEDAQETRGCSIN
jgi:hypothetical protein